MNSAFVRDRYLKFFEERGHKVLPGSSLIPPDPSLLVTTAGMVQFVPFFKGELKPEYTRMATVQRCMRTTDIDNVGHTARHLTFFEMLGNFSVGDYFKEEAIPWAWEFVTKELKIAPGKLWISIFTDDDEAFKIWTEKAGVPADRIIRLGEDDNFWTMGPTGPCGPSSEILYDFGEGMSCGPDCAPGCDCDRFLEIWNLVFTEFNRLEDGTLEPLPRKNIDTGMGLERVAAILEDVPTNFDTDVLRPIIAEVERLSGVSYGKEPAKDVSLKIVADHSRAVTFMVNDGILPSNEGRGYVLRRLLRRAVRHGRLLGIEEPFIQQVVGKIVEVMGPVYPDVQGNLAFIKEILASEEERFDITVKQGLAVIDGIVAGAVKAGAKSLGAEDAFKLYDTYGFPIELTKEIAEENGLAIDEEGVAELMEDQRRKARAAAGERASGAAAEIFAGVLEAYGETKFIGYSQDEAVTSITAIVRDDRAVQEANEGDAIAVVLKETPFYAEMGGQVGDKGSIRAKDLLLDVVDTVTPLSGLVVHHCVVKKGRVRVGDEITAVIDIERRNAIRRNHTGTHLLHWALRMILGEHVRQGGSYVDEHRLRFDFTHSKGLTPEEIAHLETLINKRVVDNQPVKAYTTTFKFAVESGAIAFFGEKYGKYVRVLEIGDFSRELCGGTHVSRTGDIGQLKITAESSVGANLRRIEAVTGMGALLNAQEAEAAMRALETSLKTGRSGLLDRVKAMTDAAKAKDKELASLKSKQSSGQVKDIIDKAGEADGVKIIGAVVPDRRMDDLRVMADEIRNQVKTAAVVLGSSAEGAVSLLIALTADVAQRGVKANDIIKDIGPMIGGGGGGRPDLAQAGGKNAGGLEEAVSKAEELIRDRLV